MDLGVSIEKVRSFMKYPCLFLPLLATILVGCSMLTIREDVSRKELVDRAKASAAKTMKSTQDAGAYREMALRAVENAFASRDDAEEVLLQALRDGDQRLIDLAKDNLEDIVEESGRAISQGERVIQYVLEAETAANAAVAEAERVAESDTYRDAAKSGKKTSCLEEDAAKASGKAFDAVAVLRERWLIRKPSATTTTTAQPPLSAPIDK
jgi:hypothetical protein